MASKVHFWQFVSVAAGLVSALFLLQRHRKIRSSRPKFCIVEADETSGSLEVDSPLPGNWTSLCLEQPLVIAMSGLPARGKSYVVKMIMRYLRWTGFECKLFNVGSYRRKMGLASADSSFFSAGNNDASKMREELAMSVQESMYEWLHEGNTSSSAKRRVAIFDATNTTINRRLALAQKARKENVYLLFVESICDDNAVLAQNYALKLQNDDYKDMDPEKAMTDFMDRVHAYEKVYQTIEDNEDNNRISYIKLINVGQKVITRNCTGYLPSQVAFYLQNVHIQPRSIYLSLNAENFDLVEDSGRLGGAESGRLTDSGRCYSRDIARYLLVQHKTEHVGCDSKDPNRGLLVLAGGARVHSETLLHLQVLFSCYNTALLNELRGGDLHMLSKEEIKNRFPQEHFNREADKLRYRYPGVGGESYLDVIERIRPVIIELERQRRSVLVVCHLAVLRCIFAYFMGTKLEDVPFQAFQRHTIYELKPGPFGCTCRVINPEEELMHI